MACSHCLYGFPIFEAAVSHSRGHHRADLSDLTAHLFALGLAVGLDPEGYGNPDFCWISIYDKLIWSFAGPIGIVILVNISLFV